MSRRKWFSLTMLSIIVPVSLLVTFRLAGFLREPSTPQVITVETVNWNMTRPTLIKSINERLMNSFNDTMLSVVLTVNIADYFEDSWTFDGDDALSSLVSFNVSVRQGSISSLIISFTEVDDNAWVDISEDLDNPFSWQSINLNVIKIEDGDFGRNAYIKFSSINHLENTFLRSRVTWEFNDKNIIDHWLTVILQITHVKDTETQVIVPIRIGVIAER